MEAKISRTEIKRKIRICNQMIKVHEDAKTIFSRNAISIWNMQKKNLTNVLKNDYGT
jgi:hypothetical protein